MKKTLLMFVSLVLTTVSALALPTKPVVNQFTPWALNAQGYLYNVDAGMFITNGNWWGTHACGADNGKADGSNFVTFDDVLYGRAKLKGHLWKIGEGDNNTVDGVETECYVIENLTLGGDKFLFHAEGAGDDIWVDGKGEKNYNGWYVKQNPDNTFKLMYAGLGTLGFQKLAEGNVNVFLDKEDVTTNTTWVLVSAEVYKNVIDGLNIYYVSNTLNELLTSAKALGVTKDFSAYEALLESDTTKYEDYAKAAQALHPFIALGESIAEAKKLDAAHDWSSFENVYANDKSTAAEIDSTLAHLKAYMSLKKKLNTALSEYPKLDFSAPKAVYDAMGSTNEELAAAEAQIDKIIADYNQSQATLEKPADITATIPYVTDLAALAAGNGVLPKAGWTSTKKDGNFHVNTWSEEGNPGNDGTNMTTPFLEYWKGKGNNLDDQIFYRDPERDEFTVLPGAYRISSNIRIYNESGADYMTGAYLFGNLNRTNLVKPEVESQNNAIEGAVYGTYKDMLYYWKDSFETYAIVPADGILKFGVQTEGANFNWVATKNWKVEYLGDAYESLDYVRKNSELRADSYADETIAQKSLLAEYNKAVENYKSATTAEAISEGYANISILMDSIISNVAAYEAYIAETERIEEYLANNPMRDNDYTLYLSDYFNIDPLGPDMVPENGNKAYILENLNLDTKAILAETDTIGKILLLAITSGLEPGDDCSDMLVNASFADGFNGWVNNCKGEFANGAVGDFSKFDLPNNVELYNGTVDCYQIVNNVPDGVYSLTLRAFERPAGNGNYDGTEPSKVFLYMNELETPVQNIVTGALPDDKAEDGVNCYKTNKYNLPDPQGLTDYEISGKGWVPNGMAGAAVAFNAGRYEQTVYGLVEGGTMKIGITSKGANAHWVLWSDFKLTYLGKDAAYLILEAQNNALEEAIAKLDSYLGENELTDPEFNAASKVIDDAGNVYDYASELVDPDADSEEINAAIDSVKATIVKIEAALEYAQENVKALKTLGEAYDALSDIVNSPVVDNPSQEALDAATALIECYDEGDYLNLTTEEVKTLTEQFDEAASALRVPGDIIASDEEPFDMTSAIVNADIEAGINEGWSHSGATAFGQKSSGIETISFEFWGGSAADAAKNLQFDVWQTLVALPAGKYELQAELINSLNKQKDLGNPGRAFLYAATFTADSDTTQYSTAVDVTGQKEDGTYKDDANVLSEDAKVYSVIFTVEEGQKVRIGVKTSGVMTARWFIGDNFKLWYYGTASEKEDSEDPSGVEAIEAAGAEIVAIYTVSGARIATLQKGINIVKYADGTTKKVIVQ